jgi:hypothetical protein
MEYYSALNRRDILSHGLPQISLEDIISRKLSVIKEQTLYGYACRR